MESLYEIVATWGYLGMFVVAFLSGSVLPMTSDPLIAILAANGLNPYLLLVSAVSGNTLGTMSCFKVGTMTNKTSLGKRLKIPEKRIVQADNLIRKYGLFAAFFSFLPFIGEAMVAVLGVMRANWVKVLWVVALGKTVRYIVVMLSTYGLMAL